MSSHASQHGAATGETPLAAASDTLKKLIGRNIRAGRDAKGMTQRELALALDVDTMQISRWENGRHRPSAGAEVELAQILFDGDLVRLYQATEPEAVA
jgi:transcriptional regulator with XRE-family HTH domain